MGPKVAKIIGRFTMESKAVFEELKVKGSEFVGLLAKEDYPDAYSRFDVGLKSALSEAQLRETWQKLVAQVGPIRQITDISEISARPRWPGSGSCSSSASSKRRPSNCR